jgi:hypothetical protein
MTQIIQACGVAALYAVNALIMYVLGWFLTEVIALPWKVKPFTCRECLTFWFTLLAGCTLGFFITPHLSIGTAAEARSFVRAGLCGVSALSGLTTFFYIKSKFQINE